MPFFVMESSSSYAYKKNLVKWALDSKQIIQNRFVGSDFGIFPKTNYELFKEKTLPSSQIRKIFPDIKTYFAKNLPDSYCYVWEFSTYVMEINTYLPKLKTMFKKLGEISRKKIQNMEDISSLPEVYIFNCLGFGSKEIFHDQSITGRKGQLLYYKPIKLPFSVGAGEHCLIPRSDALVVGSLFESQYESDRPDPILSKKILDEVSTWLGHKNTLIDIPKNALSINRIIRRPTAAIRPYRNGGIRITRPIKFGDKYVIHDYGHGGGGISLSWGCAKYAIQLFEEKFSL
jgi:D-amino-acid oxidase